MKSPIPGILLLCGGIACWLAQIDLLIAALLAAAGFCLLAAWLNYYGNKKES
ncbi:MAG: hypothetical protein K2M79_06795 [Muribaculaceae bacterium]|nr:hypothetical protein [Muribaculaceae bacterium]